MQRWLVSARRAWDQELGAQPLGEVSQDVCIDGIGLGQLAGGLGKVPDLTGVNDHDGEPGVGQGAGEVRLQPTGGL